MKISFKKSILSGIMLVIFSTVILSNILGYMFQENKKYSIQINKDKIYPNLLQMSYLLKKKEIELLNNKNNKKINNDIQYLKKIYKMVLFENIKNTLFKQFVKNINSKIDIKKTIEFIKNAKYFQKKKNLI